MNVPKQSDVWKNLARIYIKRARNMLNHFEDQVDNAYFDKEDIRMVNRIQNCCLNLIKGGDRILGEGTSKIMISDE